MSPSAFGACWDLGGYLDEQEVATLFVEVVKLDWVSTSNNDRHTNTHRLGLPIIIIKIIMPIGLRWQTL